MSWSHLVAEARDDYTIIVLLTVALANILLRRFAPEDVRRRQMMAALALFHVLLIPVAAAFRPSAGEAYRDVRLACLWFGAIATITATGAILFVGILGRLRVNPPPLFQDLIIGTFSLFALFTAATHLGVNLSGLVATSAVITAVIGLSMQDTLLNVIGGVTLQFDNSIIVGDWVKLGDISGRVTEIRWRHTAIETRNWETLVIPNSRMVKEQFLVLGRRQDEPEYWRRWVWFNVDYRFSPTAVIAAADRAVQSAPIALVAATPAPHALFMGFEDSYARYAVRYWLTDLAKDDPTDSVIRTRLYFALQRAGIPLSIPAHAVFLTKESKARSDDKAREAEANRIDALRQIDLFANLEAEELAQLADGLRPAPFTAGEVMTKQGAEAHWLYIVLEGEASVRVEEDGEVTEIGRVHGGDFFGEMSLMTGAKRSATVVASTDVECWRLDKHAFQTLLERRPELAGGIASILAQREARPTERRVIAPDRAHLAEATNDMLGRIRHFFGLG